MPGSETFRILVAVETDATRYYGADASRPALLGATDAEQMLAHLAADLQSLLPGVSDCTLVAAGALFDQTQILRPGYPVFAALELAADQPGADLAKPGLVSIAARDGAMPLSDLQPLSDIPLGLLQLLPIVIQGPPKRMKRLTEAMEYRFLEEGQLSAHSAAWLQSAFGVSIQHARLMTLTDLSALLRMQLDHFGFLSLWELLDAALSDPGKELSVTSAGGQKWVWKEGAAHAVFETFDHWASKGGGAKLPGSRLALAAGYADWTRELRQHLTTLAAHGIDVSLRLPGSDTPLAGPYFRESSVTAVDSHACAVTEHDFDDLGTIAITLVRDGAVENFYPLRPQGLNAIHALLRNRIPSGHTVAYPGTILYEESTRSLRPDTGCEPGIH
jgi:hypothetical protein